MILFLTLVALLIVQTIAQSIQYQQLGPSIHSHAGVLAVSSAFNLSINAVPNNAPIIRIGYLLAMSGDDRSSIALDYGMRDFIQMQVDLTNSRGGVWINGIQYAVSAVIVDDQSSSMLTIMAVRDMVNSQSVRTIVLPVLDTLALSLLKSSQDLNVSFVTALGFNPCIYHTGAKNLFGLTITNRILHHKTLDALNQQAKLFYPPDVSQWPFTSTGYVSPFGFTTMCILAFAGTSPCQPLAQPLLDWIEAENLNRTAAGALAQDLISYRLIVMSPGLVSQQTQISYWTSCPDLTDVVAAPLTQPVAMSLPLSQRRFKAVFATEFRVSLQALTATERARLVAGWTFTTPLVLLAVLFWWLSFHLFLLPLFVTD